MCTFKTAMIGRGLACPPKPPISKLFAVVSFLFGAVSIGDPPPNGNIIAPVALALGVCTSPRNIEEGGWGAFYPHTCRFLCRPQLFQVVQYFFHPPTREWVSKHVCRLESYDCQRHVPLIVLNIGDVTISALLNMMIRSYLISHSLSDL